MTEQCAKSNMNTYNLEIVRRQMQKSGKMVLISFVLFCVFGGIIAFSIYKIVESVRFYYQRKQQFEAMKTKALSRNATHDASNDNNLLRTKDDEDVSKQVSDQKQYTASINNSVKTYKEYNGKIEEYYQQKFSTSAPDKIDKSILLKENDNYVKPKVIHESPTF